VPSLFVTGCAPEHGAFGDHGVPAGKLDRGVEDARVLIDDVRTAGVDLEDVWRAL
jgi:hypothetical protein